MRSVRSGSIQSAVRDAITAAGGLECASNDVGVSVTTLSRATDFDEDRPGGLGVNHLHRLGRIIPETAVPIAQHFAHLSGGFFQPIDVNGELAADMSLMMSEFADVLRTHSEAMSDRSKEPGQYTAKEAQRQIKELDELLTAIVGVRGPLLATARGEGK